MTATRTRTEAHGPRWTEYVPLDEVLRAPRNPKSHNAQVIAASMARFGIVELPSVDERTGRLVAGHGRLDDWEHRRDAGEDPPEGVITDESGAWLVPVNRGWKSRSDLDAEAYLIMSNQATIIGGWDEPALVPILEDLKAANLLEFTGFDEEALGKLAAKQLDDEAGGPDDFPGYDPETISTEHQCPSCGYRWSGSSAPRGEAETDVPPPDET